MLDYSFFDKIWFSPDKDPLEHLKAINESKAGYVKSSIESRLKKMSKKQEEIENLTYEKNLIERDVIDIIREDLCNSGFNIFNGLQMAKILDESCWYHHDHKKEECKAAYNFVLKYIKDRLIPEQYHEKIKLLEIVDFNYSSAFWFEFKLGKKEFTICIPNFPLAKSDNYLEMISGYQLHYKENDISIGLAFSSLDPDEFKEKLNQWLNKK